MITLHRSRNNFMKPISFLLPFAILAAPVFAQEREVTEEQQEVIKNGGEVIEKVEKINQLPDLTKGESLPPSDKGYQVWTLGSTGIACIMSGGFPGDQLFVTGFMKGSPADGKIFAGDVITGINGKKFEAGGHLGEYIGNAIIEAEKEENGGKMVFHVWRDKNYPARSGAKDIAGTDIDELINQTESDSSLYDWKKEEERKEEVAKMDYGKYPIDATTLDVELKIRVFPAYSDTAPYNCPKTARILEDAWKVLEEKFVADPRKPGSGKGGVIEAMALLASGKPEHKKIVHDWVRTKNCPWGPPTEPIGTMFEPGINRGGKLTWHYGYVGLYCAIYYDATGDDYVLPALRKYAIEAAMGQSKAGSWGHTFAFPSFNGGEFNMMNPGYGALNAAGNRCFFLIALAQKLGVKDPALDKAVERGQKFFGSYVDQGAIPYGDHPAAATDDSNGKNAGSAFAMKMMGDKHSAKYFAMMAAHASFTPRGGHAHDYFTNWSPWGAGLCGPQIRAYNERNFRWRRTLCRMYDGSFIYISPGGNANRRMLHDPTATEVMHQAVYLKQLLITGKDADESLYLTERDMKQMLVSAYPQLNNTWLKDIAGKPFVERGTDDLLDLLDMFMPRTRKAIAAELGKRFKAGETGIVPRLVALLANENPRYQHGALVALDACGNDVMLSNLSKILPLLDSTADFVRIAAIELASKATNDKDVQLALLKTTVAKQDVQAPNSVRNSIQSRIFAPKAPIGDSTFKLGFDANLVREALSDAILEETGGGDLVKSKIGSWDKDTVIHLAGPLTYIAEEEQVFDQMFGHRNAPAQAMLGKFGYLEALQTNGYRIRKKASIPRNARGTSGFRDPLVDPAVVTKNPGVFADLADDIKMILIDNPIEEIIIKDPSREITAPLCDVLKTIEANKKAAALPSIADDVKRMFQAELDAADGTGAKIKLCRSVLSTPDRKHTFRQIAAMDHLAETLSAEAVEDLLPYLGHDYWRVREHSRQVASPLMKGMAGAEITRLFDAHSDAEIKAGFLETLALSKPKAGLEIAKQALKNESPAVRAAAVSAYAMIGGEGVTEDILTFLKSAKTKQECFACEDALLSRIGEPVSAGRIRDRLMATISGASPQLLDSLYYLIARIGDAKCIDFLRKAAATQDPKEFSRVMYALSYAPSREADKVMLEIASSSENRAKLVTPHADRRMVIGPKGYGDITSEQRMDFAEAMLKLNLEPRIIKLLGSIHEARALRALMFCLEKSGSSYNGTAESIVANAEGMDKLSPADAKIARQTLQGVIEYIEINYLRGGRKEHQGRRDYYSEWKALQARAGKVLLKIHKPETAPIPTFDGLDLDR